MPEYFAHDYNSHRNPKIIRLKVKLGHAGIGLYWSLIELLHEQGGALALLDDCDRDAVAMLLGTDRQTCDQFLEVASTDCKLISFANNQITCERVDENLQQREDATKKAKDKARLRWKKRDATAMPQHSHSNADAMLLKEIKLKEIKLKDLNTEDLSFSHLERIFDPEQPKNGNGNGHHPPEPPEQATQPPEAPPQIAPEQPKPARKHKPPPKEPPGFRPETRAFGPYKHVFLKEAEYERFVNMFGEDSTHRKITSLDASIENKQRKYMSYQNHDATLRSWFAREAQN